MVVFCSNKHWLVISRQFGAKNGLMYVDIYYTFVLFMQRDLWRKETCVGFTSVYKCWHEICICKGSARDCFIWAVEWVR